MQNKLGLSNIYNPKAIFLNSWFSCLFGVSLGCLAGVFFKVCLVSFFFGGKGEGYSILTVCLKKRVWSRVIGIKNLIMNEYTPRCYR